MPAALSQRAQQIKPSSTLAITAYAKELKAQGIDIVSFTAGEPDFPTPENICEAAKRAIDAGQTRYTPAAGTMELRKAISEKFLRENGLHYAPEQIVVSTGGKQSLVNALEAVLDPGDEVIIPIPFWLSYEAMVRLADGVPVFVSRGEEYGYKLSGDSLRAAVTERTKAVILNDPNNPSGAVYTREELEDIARAAVEEDIFVIADEMYEALVYDGMEHISIASLGPEIAERTITVCGVSKSYAMTGWRIGYAGAPKEIAAKMGSIQSHQTSNPCSIAQAAALEAVSGPQEARLAMRDAFDRRHNYIYERMSTVPYFTAVKPHGAFFLFVNCRGAYGKDYRGTEISSAAQIAEFLLRDYHVAVVPCADFGCPNTMRLSYAASMEDIEKGMDRLQAFAEELK